MSKLLSTHILLTTALIGSCESFSSGKGKTSLLDLLIKNHDFRNRMFPPINYPLNKQKDFFGHMHDWIESYFSEDYHTTLSKNQLHVTDKQDSNFIVATYNKDYIAVINRKTEYRFSFLSDDGQFIHYRLSESKDTNDQVKIEGLPRSWYRGRVKGLKIRSIFNSSEIYMLLYTTNALNPNTPKNKMSRIKEHILLERRLLSNSTINEKAIKSTVEATRNLIKSFLEC